MSSTQPLPQLQPLGALPPHWPWHESGEPPLLPPHTLV